MQRTASVAKIVGVSEPPAATLWNQIVARAAAEPLRPAVTGTATASYGDLVERVERTASRLADRCCPGDVLAVQMPTSLPSMIAMLAALKLGVAFLPVEVSDPTACREYQLRDAGVRLLLRHDPDAPDELTIECTDVPDSVTIPHDTAYLMYTSGSTGRPKGVLVSERALRTRLDAYAIRPGFTADSSFLAMAAPTFDISLAEQLLPLRVGGRVVLATPTTRLDPQEFTEFVRRECPDVIQATPTFWRMTLGLGWPGAPDAVLWSGGETMTAQLARELRPRCLRLWNLYGPTEATLWATAALVEPDRPISLGEPCAGSCHLVRTDRTIITAPGEEGEIVLAGVPVALGYLGDSAQQYRFTTVPGIDGRAYLSGDRGRYQADGSLEFLGRRDTQIKLRGHRLELGEVEAALEEHPKVRQAAVFHCLPDDPAREHLAAAVATTRPTSERALRDWLGERLPAHMLPQRIMVRAGLPRTTTGKVDRAALQAELAGLSWDVISPLSPAHLPDQALGAKVSPVFLYVCQAGLASIWAVYQSPTGRYLRERGPQRVLALVVNQYSLLDGVIIEGVGAHGLALLAIWCSCGAEMGRQMRPIRARNYGCIISSWMHVTSWFAIRPAPWGCLWGGRW
jgi:D-alanine--poly(phosphoribitol) ligase subunit 1